ncbi:MAG: DUF502 domain-containing protein, partial [Phycisphaerales bacterium]|nr:DUF502 domain-containing protein [Phycisphaerales bacterium]
MARSSLPPRSRPTFSKDFKRFFLRGLGILLPSVLTLWILVQAYFFLDARVAQPINRGVRSAVVWVVPRTFPKSLQPRWFVVTDDEVKTFRANLESHPDASQRALARQTDEALRADLRAFELRRFWDNHWYLRFIGLIIAVTLIYLAGRVLGGFLGRRAAGRVERFITRIPLFKQVYPHVKQLVDLVLGERSMAFKRVVMVQYPRQGIYSLGFVTGGALRGAAEAIGGEALTVFVPSTPTPFTGFTITILASEAIDMPISVDEAIRFVLTGGVLAPGGPSPPAAAGEVANGA